MKSRKEKLQDLINKYKNYKQQGKLNFSSEETIRSWINELLAIFNWDVKDTSIILQEKILSEEEKEKVYDINSSFTRPDYTFVMGNQKLTFLDAKSLNINLKKDKKSAFQIKSYGWSISAPCAFITNFEEFVIYDCSYIPTEEQPADYGRIYFSIDNYIENFDILENHLLRENIIGGKLQKLYAGYEKKNIKTIDIVFAEQLSSFRLSLADDILKNNKDLLKDNLEQLSYITQVIINRILFIRICEAKHIEKEGLLKKFYKKGFWESFKESSYNDFYQHYDGPLFDRIEIFQKIIISDEVFELILNLLYYPSPYRFDVIPTKLLSDIYEIFLSKKLVIKDGFVDEELKLEYIKSNGAVSTPQYLVEDLIKRTMVSNELTKNGIDGIFNTKILDFACGSGVFLVMIFEYIENILIKLYTMQPNPEYKNLFFEQNESVILTIEGRRKIISNCIYGIDIDPEAYEVAKMSLSLKVIDTLGFNDNYQEIGIFGSKILNSVGKNIKCGNTLIGLDIIEKYPSILNKEEELLRTNPFDWNSKEGFDVIFKEKGGFDFIVGNPPYVEVKNYNTVYPLMHKYIKEQYKSTKNGKIDLSIAFIERGISLLNSQGKMGLIVQSRWFKTNYAKKIREYIISNKLLSQVIMFEANNIFKNRITYIASLILSKKSKEKVIFKYIKESSEELPLILENLIPYEINKSDFETIPLNAFSSNPWNFENTELLKIKTNLLEKFGSFKSFATVRVGIQVLWDRAYHIKVTSFNDDGTITGDTGLEENVTLEIDACRPLILNKKFYPYCKDETDIYVIFPYNIVNKESDPILFSDFSTKYPLVGNYLSRHKKTIQKNVETYNGEEWHLYTRANNHQRIEPKVMIPMTAQDTFANITFNPLNYCDNANMFFIDIPYKSENNLYAVASIINSTLFSVLARSIALKQQNGYFKFNKQFIEPIPFPTKNFVYNSQLVNKIAKIGKQIENLQNKYIYSSPKQKNIFKSLLNKHWEKLDELVFKLYELDNNEKMLFLEIGRNINRVDILDNA